MLKTLASLAAASALAGCASLNDVSSDVSSYSRWPAGRSPATYAFERLPSQQAAPQQAQMLEDSARRAVEAAGFLPVPEGSQPDVSIQLGARITVTDRSPFDDPFWYGGYGPWHRPFGYGYGRFGRSFGGPPWRYGYGGYGGYGYGFGYGSFYDTPYFEREVGLLIRDKRTGEPLYEARAESEGPRAGLGNILPVMFTAALRDFPAGSATNPHRVTLEAVPPPAVR